MAPLLGLGDDFEERKSFCNELFWVVDRVDNGYRLCALGDLNGWVEV